MTIDLKPDTVLSSTGEIPTSASPVSTPLHTITPLIHSRYLSFLTNHNIYLKLDCDQPSSSFKIRGIGAICQSAISTHGTSNTRLVTASGGNAGLAVAYAASRVGVGSSIFVPNSTEVDVVEKLTGMGAEVVVGGDSWDQADLAARELVERMGGGGVYVHPFEGDQLVFGHSGLVDEIFDQFSQLGGVGEIDAIVCSTGGGGLLRGIMIGSQRQSNPPTLIAVQNFGVDSFNRSYDSHLFSSCFSDLPTEVVALTAIESKCTSMGTKKCSLTTLHDAISYNSNPTTGGVTTLTVTDNLSASACWQFSELKEGDEKGRKVELSCASALSLTFHPWILNEVVTRSKKLNEKREKGGNKVRLNVVIEVCGGSKVNQTLLEGYKKAAGKMELGDRIRVNNVDISPPHNSCQ